MSSGRWDLVLVSHDNHPDNLDDRGRALALAAPLVLTTSSGAGRLGHPAVGLAAWTSHSVERPGGSELTVTAVPAVHGPEDAVVLHAGAARVPDKFRGRALSLDSIRAAAAAAILGPAMVIPAHYDGWAHFSEGRADLARAFDDAGLSALLRLSDHGTWVSLKS
jgi:L-ascorbate metabolism protein UlaG (beta-lactamase superfamily)